MVLTQIKNMPCTGWIYMIEYTKEIVPALHGIVRMTTGKKKKKTISATDPNFKGKNKIGTYVYFRKPHIEARTRIIKNGMITKYLDRVEITINITTPEVYFMLENVELLIEIIMNDNKQVFKPYLHLIPEYKLIYPHGESHDYDDLENLHNYLNELDNIDEERLQRISGIAFIYHI